MNQARSPLAFSLVELLVVLAILAVLAVLTLPAVGNSLRSTRLTQGTQLVLDQFHLARQLAVSRNRTMETRFYRFAGEEGWRGMQNFELREDGTSEPAGRLVKLPDGVLLSAASALSPLLENERAKAWTASDPQTSLPGAGTSYETRRILFHPDGTTDLPADGRHWFLTLHTDEKGANLTALPSNFSLVQVNPWTGRSQLYRP